MNREDIIRMADQCGIPEFENNESQADNILRFAALVAAAERNRIWTQDHWTEYEQSIYARGVMNERKRIVNLLIIQHDAAKGAHNYWHVAANLIETDVASDT